MISRTLSEKLQHLTTKYPVISLTGPRQSGKTTLLRNLFPDYTYVNLELPPVRQAAKESPLAFLQQGNPGMIIDEAQHVPELFSYIQVAQSYLVYGGDQRLDDENGNLRAWRHLPELWK